MSDRRRVPENEQSDSEDEGNNRRNERSYKERSLMSYDRERVPPETTEEADDEFDVVMNE